MSSFVANILSLVILIIVEQSDSLVELPQVVDNDILKTELVIRTATNKIFTSIKLNGVRENSKLKQYRLIHNYFVSLTLKDHNNLKEIARLTRVDKKSIDNTSIKFIDLINEVLNEGHFDYNANSYSLGDTFNGIVKYIDDYSNGIAYLKATYGDESPRVDINKDIINILANDERYLNKTAVREQTVSPDDDDLLTDNEFWVPDLRRIFEGKRTKIKDFPFMASVEIFNRFQCAGSIIRNDLVLTAASCLQLAWNNRFYRENPQFLSVRVGSDYYEMGGENIPVLEVYFYPSYNPQTLKNNVAIMRLVRKIKFSHKRKRVRQIPFDTKPMPVSMCTRGVTIVGWGAQTKSNIIRAPYEGKLSFARLDVYMLEDCQDIYGKKYVTKKNFCAGFVSKGHGAACNKDVGGPGIISGVLKGIISFGSPACGTPDSPTVFTKVGYYADWIEEIIEQEPNIPVLKKDTTTRLPSTAYNFPSYRTQSETWRVTEKTPYVSFITDVAGTPSLPSYQNYLKTMFNSKELEEFMHLADTTSSTSTTLPSYKDYLKSMFSSKEIEQYMHSADATTTASPTLPSYKDYLKTMFNAEEIEKYKHLANSSAGSSPSLPSYKDYLKTIFTSKEIEQYMHSADALTSTPPTLPSYKDYLKSMFNAEEIEKYMRLADLTRYSTTLPPYKEIDKYMIAAFANQNQQNPDTLANNNEVKNGNGFGITPVEHKSQEFPQIPAVVGGQAFFKSFDTNEIDVDTNNIKVFKAGEKSSPETLENDDIETKTSNESKSNKKIQREINKLVKNVNLEEKIAQVAMNGSDIFNKKGLPNKTLLSALRTSDVKGKLRYNVQGSSDKQVTPIVDLEGKDNSLHEMSSNDNGDKIYGQQELVWDEQSHEEVTKESLREAKTLKEDNVTTVEEGHNAYGGIFSKRLLHDIVSYLVEIKNGSKSNN